MRIIDIFLYHISTISVDDVRDLSQKDVFTLSCSIWLYDERSCVIFMFHIFNESLIVIRQTIGGREETVLNWVYLLHFHQILA